ncbi:hypothetical protein P4O66_021061, partial [Electrophorus voltai]
HFVREFSVKAHPLTNLLHGKNNQLSWGPVIENAFKELKMAFTTTSLQHPNRASPFNVEDGMKGCVVYTDFFCNKFFNENETETDYKHSDNVTELEYVTSRAGEVLTSSGDIVGQWREQPSEHVLTRGSA